MITNYRSDEYFKLIKVTLTFHFYYVIILAKV